MRTLLLAVSLTVAGCAGTPPADAPREPVPVVRAVPGGTAAADLSGYPGAVLGVPGSDSLSVAMGAAGRVAVDAEATFEGLALVPFVACGEPFAFAVEAPRGPGRLALTFVGVRPEDPTVVDLDLVQLDADGQPTALTVDEDTGIVVLVGDRIPSDNAVDLSPTGRIGIDLDVAPPGAHRVRVAARAGGLVSEWVAFTVRDGRLAP